MIHHGQALLLNLDRLLHYFIFGIEFAQAEVVSREFRSQDQLNILQIRRRALQAGVGGLESLAGSTEQIDFVIQGEGNLVQALRQRLTWNRIFRAVAGVTRFRDALGSALSGWK